VPCGHLVIESAIKPSFRVEQVSGMFDLAKQAKLRHEWHVQIPIEELDWQIGLIVGPSGSGKTTIAHRLFPDAYFHQGYKWPAEAAVVDGFPKALSVRDITQALSSVGFSSPPHWLKRYAHLSNGQQFRCELARLMLEAAPVVIFDEWTSVVDRDAAKISSAAVAKALRSRQRPRLIACSCHYDVIDWLDPDWVYNTATGKFARRSLRRRPAIELAIHPASPRAWALFSGHHYLTGNIHRAAQCWVATWQGVPVGFTSCLPLVGFAGVRREHRTVVLPDYQGVGIGNALSEWLGAHLAGQGLRFRSVSSHPAMIRHRERSPKWKLCRFGHVEASRPAHKCKSGRKIGDLQATQSSGRLTATFEYVGGR
jgi:GNAT superfamily N-acetyltransferase/alpha-D-ribose 1-methylphosphonate 5-triphosphate synthase subunit PhnL